MRTISYILVKEPTGEVRGTAACRGDLCYTGRVLLEQFKMPERIERLISEGPIDMVGYFEDEVGDLINPAIVKKAEYEQVGRLPYAFKKNPAKFESLQALKNELKEHNHFSAVNFFLYENNQWYHSKHSLNKLNKLTMIAVDYDDEDNG